MSKTKIHAKRRPLRCWLGKHHWLFMHRWGIEGEADALQYRCYYCDQLGHAREPHREQAA